MRLSHLSEYLLRQAGEGHDSRKSQYWKETKTKSDYHKNQFECLISLWQKCGTAVWGYCEVFPIPSTRMICYVMLKLFNTRDHQK
jgi:hypothetical protein